MSNEHKQGRNYTFDAEPRAGMTSDQILHRELLKFVSEEIRHRMAIASPDDTAGITRRYIDLWCQLQCADALQRIATLPESLVEAVRSSMLSLRDEGVIDRLVESIEAGIGISRAHTRASEEHS